MKHQKTTSKRYEVGNTYYFCSVKFTKTKVSLDMFTSLYIPWIDALREVDIVALRCKECVAVRTEWEDEKSATGFIFENINKDGEIWHNQYPYASYGQLDDSMDRIVNPAKPEDDKLGSSDDRYNRTQSYRLLTDLINDQYRALDKNNNGMIGSYIGDEMRAGVEGKAIREYNEMLIKRVEGMSQMKIVRAPVVFTKIDGTKIESKVLTTKLI